MFQYWGFSSITMIFLQRNFHVFVIHELVVNLVRGGKLLDNIDPGQPKNSLWGSMESLRCCPVMQALFPGFIRASICVHP